MVTEKRSTVSEIFIDLDIAYGKVFTKILKKISKVCGTLRKLTKAVKSSYREREREKCMCMN